MRKLRGGLLAAALVVAATAFAYAGPKPDPSAAEAGPVQVDAKPITSFVRFGSGAEPSGKVRFRGGLVLTSPSKLFGGWSGLIVADDTKKFLAISDTGVWLTGQIAYDNDRPSGVTNARLGPIEGADGHPVERRRDRDAESTTLVSGSLDSGEVLISYERRPRIARYRISTEGLSSERSKIDLPDAMRHMNRNQGLEAVAVIKGGPNKDRLIAFAERLYDSSRNHTGWIWTANGPKKIHLQNIGDFDVTDVASLEDGTLFVLERRFRWTEGVKMRLRRIPAAEVIAGRTMTGETLIEANLENEIDNMEGLSVVTTKSGDTLVTMISDDNFNAVVQRTVLLQFVLADGPQAKARPQD